MTRRRKAAIVAIVAAGAAQGCFEAPVRETVGLRFLSEGRALLVSETRLSSPSRFDSSPAVQARLDRLEADIREGRDPWTRRIAAAEPEALRTTLDESKGHVDRITRQALLDDASGVERFFADTGARASYRAGDGWAELSFLPDASGNATYQERRQVEDRFRQWSQSVSRYLDATSRLYDYLDARPDRARDVLGKFFDKILDEATKAGLGPRSDDEDSILDAVDDAAEGVLSVLTVEEGEAYTLDELSRRVYDPFPAPVTVWVPGAVLEREGFPGALQDPLAIPQRSLWSAFAGLDGLWVDPDPLVAWVRHDLEAGGRRFDLDGFVARPRRHEPPPDAVAVRATIEDRLKPAPFYRVRWATVNLEPEDLDEVLKLP